MKNLMKIVHLISLCVFFGSIVTYVFLGLITPETDMHALALNREWVLKSTTYLTGVAMCTTGFTGLVLSGKPKSFWVWAKLFSFMLICLNTYFFVYPAIVTSTLALGTDELKFLEALEYEAVFGAFNIVLILMSIVFAVSKPKLSVAGIKRAMRAN